VNEMKHVEIGFLDVAYRRRGSGTPLLLLHGREGDHHDFDGVVEVLSPQFETIAYDQRDCGETVDHSDRDYSLKDLAKDAAEFIVSLGFDKMHVVGHSAGGIVAQGLALYFPERIDHLILDVTIPVNEDVRNSNPGALERFARFRANEDYRGMAEMLSTPGYVAQHPELIETVRRSVRPHLALSPEKHARRMRAITTSLPDADLGAIIHKTLVLAGECDQLATLDVVKRLASRLSNAELKVIPAAGHTAILENPELYCKLVSSFLHLPPGP
jgi:pimeloyl-ACP methyl ester carboxylesterase